MKRKQTIRIFIPVVILLFIFIIVIIRLRQPGPPQIVPDMVKPEMTTPEGQLEESPKEYKARVAIVIDDMGYDDKIFREFAGLGVPVTFAVLPGERFSKYIANEAKLLNYDVMLHLPLEPHSSGKNPGNGVILLRMSRDEMLQQLSKDIAAVPYITGVNNHMGSLFTEDRSAMGILLGELHKKGLFFLDSRTSPQSVAYDVAKNMGVKSESRDVFLDNRSDIEYIKGQIDKVIRIAIKKGDATAIGHPRPETVTALKEKLQDFEKEGIELVPVSKVID